VREFVTTLLDTLGLLLIAAGMVGGAWAYIGASALCIGGVVLLAGAWLASHIQEAAAQGDDA